MLIEMWSPAFKEKGVQRPLIKFRKGLNVVLGKEDGAMSIGKSSALLAIDFAFGGGTYAKSDGVKQEGHHSIFFAYEFNRTPYYFERNTASSDLIFGCDQNYKRIGKQLSKDEFTNWLKIQYQMDFSGISFRTAVSSFFRIYGKRNHDELNPLLGVPGQNMEKSINTILTLFNRYKDIEEFKDKVAEQKKRLDAYNKARDYNYISNLVGGDKAYEENLQRIRSLEYELTTLVEVADQGYTDDEIEKNKLKADLRTIKLNTETQIQAKEMRCRLVDMSLEYGLYPTEADMSALQEYFPEVNLRKLYEVEKYHQKLAKILNGQFNSERERLQQEIEELQGILQEVNGKIKQLGFVGNISKDFLDRHSEIKGEIRALQIQNEEYIRHKGLQDAKKKADEILKRSIESILQEIEDTLNNQMREFNDSLFQTRRKPPYIHFNSYSSYRFETPQDKGTGTNFKGMIVYDLAILFTTALPALAHDSLLFKNLEKDVEDGIIKIYNSTDKQVFIAYDKQADCRASTKKILEERSVLKLSNDHCELYGRSWNIEE